jgi:hypothetical protein
MLYLPPPRLDSSHVSHTAGDDDGRRPRPGRALAGGEQDEEATASHAIPAPQPRLVSHRRAGPRNWTPGDSETYLQRAGCSRVGREKDGREGRKISAGPAVAPRSLGSFWITAATSLVLRTATSFTAWPRDARVALMLTRVAQIQRVPRFIGSH